MTTTTTYSWSRARLSLARLPAARLLADLQGLVAQDRQVTAAVLAHLAEVDARRLYLEAACSSLHGYCVTRLHYSEPAAYKRVHAARAARAFPIIFDLVARGELHLAAVTLLAPHLTAANHAELLAAARHQSKRAIEELVAARFPVADVPTRVRALPAPTPAPQAPAPEAVAAPAPAFLPLPAPQARALPPLAPQALAPPPSGPRAAASPPTPAPPPPPASPPRPAPAVVAPLSADRFRVQFTASRATRDRLREAQDLLRRQVPDGDLDAVIGQALTLLVGELKRRRFAATSRPRTSAPEVEGGHAAHLPAAVKRAVAERDGYQCTFVDAAGQRCPARARLEFHHGDPRGRGGGHTVDAVTLRCPGHHALATARDYGDAHVARAVAARRARRQRAPGAATGDGAGRGSAAPGDGDGRGCAATGVGAVRGSAATGAEPRGPRGPSHSGVAGPPPAPVPPAPVLPAPG